MALKLAIVGPPNTGKSYSRKSIKNGEDVFIIAPSAKAMHMTDSEGKPLKRLNLKNKTLEELAPGNPPYKILESLMKKDLSNVEFVGNYIISSIHSVENMLQFVNTHMLHIKTIILPDFTHFITSILSSKEFIKRKSGGEAFQRYNELAGDVMQNLVSSIDSLREDLIVVTEYHSEYDEQLEQWVIFTPGGKMITEKFKIESYYDYMVYSHVDIPETGNVDKDCYKFITRRWDKYPARMSELFEDTRIPNDLESILTKMREASGI